MTASIDQVYELIDDQWVSPGRDPVDTGGDHSLFADTFSDTF